MGRFPPVSSPPGVVSLPSPSQSSVGDRARPAGGSQQRSIRAARPGRLRTPGDRRVLVCPSSDGHMGTRMGTRLRNAPRPPLENQHVGAQVRVLSWAPTNRSKRRPARAGLRFFPPGTASPRKRSRRRDHPSQEPLQRRPYARSVVGAASAATVRPTSRRQPYARSVAVAASAATVRPPVAAEAAPTGSAVGDPAGAADPRGRRRKRLLPGASRRRQANGSCSTMLASRSGPVDTIASGQPTSSSSERR
jgi:hypothetical protein